MTIINTTITGNSPMDGMGGGILGGGYASIINSTIFNNTGADLAVVGQSYKLQNTILGSCGGNCDTLISLGNNLIVDPDCLQPLNSICSPIITQSTDLKGVDPHFDTFTDNGTPGDGHFPLLSTSPAIDAGTNDVYLTYHQTHTDQRGNPRADGDNNGSFVCDIGAVEYQSSTNRYRFVVMADSRAKSCKPGTRECINYGTLTDILTDIKGTLTATQAPPPSFILFGGDLILGSTTVAAVNVENELNHWIEIVDEIMGEGYAKSRIYPAFGSHERNKIEEDGYPSIWSAFSKVFDPVNDGFLGPLKSEYIDDAANYGNTVYYLDYQNARFFALNNDYDTKGTTTSFYDKGTARPNSGFGHEISGSQTTWLDNKLSGLTSDNLKFFMYHEPAYGVNSHVGYDPRVYMAAKPVSRNDFLEVITNHATPATMLFCGHEHHYTRSEVGKMYVVDNGSAGYSSAPQGIWSNSKNDSEWYGSDYQTANTIGTQANPTGTATWSFNIPTQGTYTVYAWWPVSTSSATDAPYTIDNNGNILGTTPIRKNQAQNGNKFNKLGDYSLVAGTLEVKLTNNAESNKKVVADAVKVVAHQLMEVKTGTAGAPIARGGNSSGLDFSLVKYGPVYLYHYAVVDVVGTVTGVTLHEFSSPPTVGDYFTLPPDQRISLFPDTDEDGVSDIAEGPYFNIPNIALVPTAVGGGQVLIEVSETVTLKNVNRITDTDSSVDQQNKPQSADFRFGLVGMDITGVIPGDTVTVNLTFPSDIPTNYQYWKYGFVKNCGNLTSGTQWYNLNDLGRVGGIDDGDNQITITLTDGSCGDGDGEVNGTIRDLGGLSAPKPVIVNDLVTFIRDTSSYYTTKDTTGCVLYEDTEREFGGQFSFDAILRNRSNSPFSLAGLVAEVIELTNGNVLQNADGGPGGPWARLTVPVPNDGDYADGVLSPGESVNVHFLICLTEITQFRFFVDVFGFEEAVETESKHLKFRKGSRATGKKFFGRFRP